MASVEHKRKRNGNSWRAHYGKSNGLNDTATFRDKQKECEEKMIMHSYSASVSYNLEDIVFSPPHASCRYYLFNRSSCGLSCKEVKVPRRNKLLIYGFLEKEQVPKMRLSAPLHVLVECWCRWRWHYKSIWKCYIYYLFNVLFFAKTLAIRSSFSSTIPLQLPFMSTDSTHTYGISWLQSKNVMPRCMCSVWP